MWVAKWLAEEQSYIWLNEKYKYTLSTLRLF